MIGRSLRLALWFTSALSLAGFLFVAAPQVTAPGSGSALEMAVLDQSSRMAQGVAIVSEPRSRSPVMVMPGFPFVVSGLVRMFHEQEVWQPRLVTFVMALSAAVLVVVVVFAESGSGTLGVATAGLVLIGQGLLAGPPLGAGPEVMMLLLAFVGFVSLRWGNAVFGPLAAALLLAAACFTHPAGLCFAFGALLHLAVHDRRRMLTYALALVVLVAGGHLGLSLEMGPWYNFLAWDVPLHSVRLQPVDLLSYVGIHLLGTFGVLTLSIVLAFSLPIQPWRGAVGIWTWMVAAAIVAGAIATQLSLPDVDAMRPVLVALAIAGTISIRRVTQHLSTWPGSNRLGGKSVVLAALVLQFATLLAHQYGAAKG